MQVASMHFKERAHDKLHDAQLQANLPSSRASSSPRAAPRSWSSTTSRARATLRAAIRQRALDDLDVWLDDLRARTRARAARRCCMRRRPPRSTRWCSKSPRRHDVRKIIKSKSMVSEESALDHAIEAAGLTVVETDLGEYILQINDYEPPSHIIGPALHKSQRRGGRALPRAARHAEARTASRSCASRRATCCASTT